MPGNASIGDSAAAPKNTNVVEVVKAKKPRKKKKQVAGAESGPNPSPNPKPGTPKDKNLKKDYLKTFAIFQCEQDRGHTWQSVHAWTGNTEQIECEICDKSAKITDAKDEVKY